jgi:hypothetical protein
VSSGVEVLIEFKGLDEALRKFHGLDEELLAARPRLFQVLGEALADNVKTRIITHDSGSWAPASKWSRAKTGYAYPTLLGAEKYVKFSMDQSTLRIYGKTPPEWTLTMHHKGFWNKLIGDDEPTDRFGRVILKIKDGSPLDLPSAAVFLFVPQKAAVTPARKIWPTTEEAQAIANPIASRWLQQVLKEVGVE